MGVDDNDCGLEAALAADSEEECGAGCGGGGEYEFVFDDILESEE